MAVIDIGSAARDRVGSVSPGFTRIIIENPANDDGEIAIVELQAFQKLYDCKVGTFYGTPPNFTCRDYANLGIVPAGSKQIFTGLEIDVQEGDYIGIYYSAGYLEAEFYYDWPPLTGSYYKSGDQFEAGEQAYSVSMSFLSVYGEGEAPPPPWLSVTIGGKERSILEPSLLIESLITRQIDRCSFQVEDTTGAITIDGAEEIIITIDGVRCFGGYITNVGVLVDGLTRVYDCEANDYTILAEKKVARKEYTNQFGSWIISNLVGTYLPEIDRLYVPIGYVCTGDKLIDRIAFNNKTLKECIEQICALTGWDYYVDYNKCLHYFPLETNAAPFELSDSPDNLTSYGYKMVKYSKDSSQIINKVFVKAGIYLSGDEELIYAGNGQSKETQLGYKLFPEIGKTQIRVYRNTNIEGTPTWTEMTVGVDGKDNPINFDVLYNFDEKLLKWYVAPPAFYDAVKVLGQWEVNLILEVKSRPSYEAYGRWYEYAITDESLTGREAARLRGKAILAEHAFAKENGILTCTQDGLVAGQYVKITDSIRGIQGNYLIHRVTSRILGGELFEYTVEFGEWNQDLFDILIAHKRQLEPYEEIIGWMTNVVLTKTASLVLERNSELTTHATQDYYWYDDEDDPNGSMIWDFFTWADA